MLTFLYLRFNALSLIKNPLPGYVQEREGIKLIRIIGLHHDRDQCIA